MVYGGVSRVTEAEEDRRLHFANWEMKARAEKLFSRVLMQKLTN